MLKSFHLSQPPLFAESFIGYTGVRRVRRNYLVCNIYTVLRVQVNELFFNCYGFISEDENRKSAAEEGHEYESVTRQEDENMKKFAIQKDRTAPVKSQRVSVSDDTYEQVRDFRT